jgi:hypothetical protein
MLEVFLKRQDIDFALLQVTNTNLNTYRNYSAHINEGTDRRGNAILAKEGLELSRHKTPPFGTGNGREVQRYMDDKHICSFRYREEKGKRNILQQRSDNPATIRPY